MTKRPNFLFIMTDQHRADWLGCMGHPIIETPYIDSIAAQGTMFKNFHVASPVCMPNRASFLTGRMPSVHGLRYNGCVLPKHANTFVDVLAASGYNTAAIGKVHLEPFLPQPINQQRPSPVRPVTEAWQDGFEDYNHEQPDRFQGSEYPEFEDGYYGYQHVEIVTGHGNRPGGHYQQWLRKNCKDWRRFTDPANELPHDYSCPHAYRTPMPEELYPTTWVADRAIDYLDKQMDNDDPFFAFVSFPEPHYPFNPPGKYWDMYWPDQFDLDLPYEAHRNPNPAMEYLTEQWKIGALPPTPQSAFRADKQHIREAMALTGGMIALIDEQVGRILDTLEANGLFEDTVVIFNSDHGDYLGDFDFLLKGALQFKSVTRVPMIWSDPELRLGLTTEALGSTIDLSSTILARAGLEAFNGMQGQNLLPHLFENAPLADQILIEFNDLIPRMGFEKCAKARTLLASNWRFTFYQDCNWGEFYDLVADPHETNNLWHDPTYAEAKLELSLMLNNSLTKQMDESPLARRRA
ncbi:MAG: sulfatase-like hydrolase/transferase [Pseudomonadota bacterium]